MRQVKEKKNIIEIQEDTKIGEVILEKGDKIKVLKESHFLTQLGPDFSNVTTDAYLKGGASYVASDLAEMFDYLADDWFFVDNQMHDLFIQLTVVSDKFA